MLRTAAAIAIATSLTACAPMTGDLRFVNQRTTEREYGGVFMKCQAVKLEADTFDVRVEVGGLVKRIELGSLELMARHYQAADDCLRERAGAFRSSKVALEIYVSQQHELYRRYTVER